MFGTRSVSLPKPLALAECHNLTLGSSLLATCIQCIPVICTALGLMRHHAYIRSMLISEARAVVGHNDIGLRRTCQHTAPAPPTPFPLPNTLSNGTHDGFNHNKYNTIHVHNLSYGKRICGMQAANSW